MRLYNTNFNAFTAAHTSVRIFPAGIGPIFKKRLDYLSSTKITEYWQKFFTAIYSIIDDHIKDVAPELKGVDDLLDFYRGNRRKTLLFFKLYFKSLFTQIQLKGGLRIPDLDDWEKAFEENLIIMKGVNKGGERRLYELLILRNKKSFVDFYQYSFPPPSEINERLGRIVSSAISSEGNDMYGAPPVILNFLPFLNSKTGTYRNKTFLRIRILMVCNSSSRRKSELMNLFADFYKIEKKEVLGEIDVLTSSSLLDLIATEEINNPSYKTSAYWDGLYSGIWDKYYYVSHLFISMNVPANLLLKFDDFTTYASIGINEETRNEQFKKAHADEKILSILMLAYLRKTYELDSKLQDQCKAWHEAFDGVRNGKNMNNMEKPAFLKITISPKGIEQTDTVDYVSTAVQKRIDEII